VGDHSGACSSDLLVLDGHLVTLLHSDGATIASCTWFPTSSRCALFFGYAGPCPKRGARRRLGERLDYANAWTVFLKRPGWGWHWNPNLPTSTASPWILCASQRSRFDLNNLETKAWAHVILLAGSGFVRQIKLSVSVSDWVQFPGCQSLGLEGLYEVTKRRLPMSYFRLFRSIYLSLRQVSHDDLFQCLGPKSSTEATVM